MLKLILSTIIVLNSAFSVAQTTLTYNDNIFSFTTLYVDSTLTADSVNYECVVKSITVKRRMDNKKVQVLIPEDNYPNCTLPKDQMFILEDINFDGYTDMRLIRFLPAAPNIPYYYWTYNKSQQKFERQKELEEITSPEFGNKKKLIYSSWRGSCCDHGLSTYKYISGSPTKIEESEVKEQNGKVTTTLKKLINGKMKIVKRSVEKAVE